MTMVFEEKIFQDRSCAWRCLLCWGSSLGHLQLIKFSSVSIDFYDILRRWVKNLYFSYTLL